MKRSLHSTRSNNEYKKINIRNQEIIMDCNSNKMHEETNLSLEKRNRCKIANKKTNLRRKGII